MSEQTRVLRFLNDTQAPLTIVIEPGGRSTTLAPNGLVFVVAKGPAGGDLEVEREEHRAVVYGWEGSQVAFSAVDPTQPTMADWFVAEMRKPHDPAEEARQEAYEAERDAALQAFMVREGYAPATARTRAEMELAASLQPCPTCQARGLEATQLRGSGKAGELTGACSKCGTKRSFSFAEAARPAPRPGHGDGMSAYARVLAEPSSIAARQALADEWRRNEDPRAALVDAQIQLRQHRIDKTLWTAEANKLADLERSLIEQRGAEWAGDVTKLVTSYRFHRGCVAEVTIPGHAFATVMPRLLALAPIQHVNLTLPLALEQVLASPYLAKVATLGIRSLGDELGDAQAAQLARSPTVAHLRWLSLTDNGITSAGLEALAASPHLEHCRFLDTRGNPANATPSVTELDGEPDAGRPAMADILARKFGERAWLAVPDIDAPWPPDRDDLIAF
jgi:hypothetical protein